MKEAGPLTRRSSDGPQTGGVRGSTYRLGGRKDTAAKRLRATIELTGASHSALNLADARIPQRSSAGRDHWRPVEFLVMPTDSDTASAVAFQRTEGREPAGTQ